jgi:hypothetical protein
MVKSRTLAADSTDLGAIGNLRDSFVRHLHAENKAPSTRVTYASRLDYEVSLAVELTAAIGSTPLPPPLAADFCRAALRLVALVQPMAAPSVAPSWARVSRATATRLRSCRPLPDNRFGGQAGLRRG